MSAKQKKKRNKVYRGADAKSASPHIIRVEAANRSSLGQWWFEHKKLTRIAAIATGVALAIILIIVEIITLLT